MMLRDLDLNKLSKLVSQQVDHITCIECCKYYTVPTTASCGHTLCHSCWRGRRNCASCGKQIEKKNLKLNIPLQNLREHVSTLSEAFEDLFNLKLDEFLLDSPTEIIPEPNKNVKEWLASSQNQFSAPVTSSTQSTQEHNIHTEQITSDIQIHTANNRLSDHREVVHVPLQQDDWDKIEEMPNVEKNTNKNQNHFVGPMDIEPFEFMMGDEEYTSYNPRRSSRQKENKTVTPSNNHDVSPQKNSEGSNKDSEKKFLKVAKNWNNVKKMKKEFSKLNKQNRNKLNVSIEMCKKNLNVNKEVPSISPEKLFPIEDNTPTIITSTENDDPANNNCKVIDEYEGVNEQVNMKINENMFRNTVNTINKTSENIVDVNNKEVETPRVSFIKKSTLQNKPFITDNIQIEADKPPTANTVNNDDIEITIKIGNTLTNICIKKKENDVQLKINSDRQVQTSLGNCSFNKRQISSTIIDVNNIEHNLNSENIVSTPSAPKITVTQKSFSKKNTASADTTTAQLEITESIERELTKSLDFNEMSGKETHKVNSEEQNITQGMRRQSQRPLRILDEIPEDMDLDIFDAESEKVGNVVSLNSTKNTPSAILPSNNSAKLRTPLTNDKRDRDRDDVFDLPSSKKIKLTLNKVNTTDKKQKDVTTDRDHLNNHDEIMDQGVNNVDTYMENIKNRSNNMKEMNSSQVNNPIKNISQIIDKKTSQSSFVQNPISGKPRTYPDDKYSENIFSVLENDSEILKSFDYKTQTHTQHHTTDKSNTITDLNVMELCTPVQDDDSDKSVVEDTPQKSTSFSKKKNKNESIKRNSNINITMKPHLMSKQTQNIQNNTNTEHINIISLSNTLGDSTEKSKNITVLETEPRITLETPVTITKFVDQIKHKSTPMARKSLNFNNENCDPELTICPSSFVVAQTTQEKEFLSKAFEHNLESEKCIRNKNEGLQFCLAGTCLSATEQSNVRLLCSLKKWTYVEKYTKDLTHLVVGVDEENKSQRSVKYMCALAGGKWIISYEWIEKCLEANDKVDEEQFEALDATGVPGPRRSRLAKQKLFTGISFYCMPPFSVLDVDSLKDILLASGGCVVSEAHAAHAGERPALLLAEPEHTQEDRFIYLAMELTVVPVNYEWVLNCLGNYSLDSIYELLLCPASLLPPVVAKWPPELISRNE